jgi:hypothetical protein
MSITFQQEWAYVNGSAESISNYYVFVGYNTNNAYRYCYVAKYYTSESIEAPQITLYHAGTDNTTSSKWLGVYYVACGANDTPSSSLINADLSSKNQTQIRFGKTWSGSAWSGSGSNPGIGKTTTSVKIPRGYFFVYVSTDSSTSYHTYSSIWRAGYNDSRAMALKATDVSKYTISYNANGGSGAPSSTSKYWGVNVSLSSTRCSKANTTATGYTVTFNGNGGTAGSTSISATNTISHTHSSWNTAAAGNGTSYSLGGTYSANANATLYAIYTQSTSRGSITLPSASRANYNFLGWSTSSTATTASYAAGASYTPSSSHTLYAVWQRQTVSVTYETDGGSLSNPTRTVNKGSNITLPTATECVKNGGTLLGWTTNVYGTTPDYDPGATYYITTDTIFYAIWKMGDLIYIKVNGTWKLGRVGIKLGNAWVGLD